MIGEPADPRRRRAAAWVTVALALAFHLWGLYAPVPPEAGTLWFPGLDKVAHVVLFALPTWALLRVVPSPWIALVPLLIHLPLSEWVQETFLPGRGGDVWDAVAGLLGIVFGWWTHRSASRVDGELGETGPAGRGAP